MSSKSTIDRIIGDENIKDVIFGNQEPKPEMIKTYEEYDDIYRVRHDSVHSVLCDQLGIEFGERTVESILIESKFNIINTKYFEQIKKQTPDYMSIKSNVAEIIEITISTDRTAKDRKESKYALLLYFLKKNNLKINYRILVVNPKDVYGDRAYMASIFNLDETHIDLIKNICDNTSKLLRVIHRTTIGSGFYRRRFEIDQSEIKIDISSVDVENTYLNADDKPLHSFKDVKKILSLTNQTTITEDDDEFIDVVRKFELESEFETKEVFDQGVFLRELDLRNNTKRLRSIFPVPYFQLLGEDSAVRTTENDFNSVSLIAGLMKYSSNSVLNRIGEVLGKHMSKINMETLTNESFLFPIKFSEEEASDIAIDGPGRKKFIRKGSKRHLDAQSERDFYCLSAYVDVSEIESLSYHLSDRNRISGRGSMLEDMEHVSTLGGVGLDYVKICQSIYREININSMRGDRRHKMIIKPTGFDGLYICLYPGTKLRCGELANNVWFKLIVDNSKISNDGRFQDHWAFKRLLRDNLVSHSKWISCDVHRLDHYIRAYDKILMSYTSLISTRFKSVVDLSEFKESRGMNTTIEPETHHPLYQMMNDDQTNVLGLIIMTYMEDRRVTSKMLQNVRYVVMSSISLFPKTMSAMRKVIEPVRSPLQLYYIKRLCNFCNDMKSWNPGKNCAFGNVKFDAATQTFSDKLGGSNIRMPRPLVSCGGQYAEFSEILCEMYFTMLFNKNQDDPTHASFQILGKILEGEQSYQKVKQTSDHLGYRNDESDEDFACRILKDRRTHTFSKRAIEIGSRLLREELSDPMGDQILMSMKKQNVNKTLDNFATFKSSTTTANEYYDPQIERQTTRTKCISTTLDLIEGGLKNSFEVAEKYKLEETSYQVFKKNQIGGVREILILPLTVRIRINILETISRNICYFDSREMLTHGSKKYDMVKSLLYASKKYPGKRAPIHFTMDKSRWGPSFVPIQFLYLFTSFRETLGNAFNLIMDLLIRHQNKRCYLPERLMKAWHLDEDNKYMHGDTNLQNLKKNFIKTHKTSMKNESNMGQGILHFTSSYLHLAMIAFRNELYKRYCKDIGAESDDHGDLLSSDDSYSLFCPELQPPKKAKLNKTDYVRLKIKLFMKAQQISEYLFNCRSSLVKSSINPLIGEFNSLFVSNMGFMPALIKFSLASVHPMNTDSFYRMVKESYSSSRQIVENGGTLDLYLLSSILNKKYCEEIYHTNEGGQNDLSKLDIHNVSYQLGKFPIFNPSLMLMFGPEYYNYKLYRTNWSIMNDLERKLFIASHKMIKGGLVETLAEFEDGDTVMGGMLRIEAKMGPVKQLMRFRDKATMSKEDVEKMLSDNPILIIKKPKTIEEIRFRTVQKLYTTGSAEALKNLAASIYYGRVSATVSARVFYIPGTKNDEPRTFFECVKDLLEESIDFDFESQIRFIYPKGPDYDVFTQHDSMKFDYIARNPFEILTIQTLSTHKIYSKLTQSVEDLLSYKWLKKNIPIELESKVGRDFEIIKIHYPMIKDTLDETLDSFSGERKEKIKGVLLLILKLFSLRDRSFKGVIFGPGSQDIIQTFNILEEQNTTSSMRAKRNHEINIIKRNYDSYEKIYMAHNHLICSRLNNTESKMDPWSTINEEEINTLLQDNSLNKKIKKRIFMCALDKGFMSNVESWSGKVGIIMHSWTKRQMYKDGKYVGDFEIVMFMGRFRLVIEFDSRSNLYRIYKNEFDDPELLYSMLKEFCDLLELTMEYILSKTRRGGWIMIDDKILQTRGSNGFDLQKITVMDTLMYYRCYIEVDIDRTILMSEGRRILSLDTGLLTTFAIPSEDMDFTSFNMSFLKSSRLGIFNQDFNVLYKTREDCLSVMDDMNVMKPKITQHTIDRLKLKNWEEIRNEEGVKDIIIEDMTDYIHGLMTVDIDDIKAELTGDPVADMLAHIEKTDLVSSTLTTQRIQNTRKILWNFINLKHNLICHQLLNEMRISKGTIQTISSFIQNGSRKNIMFSLISLYDRTYQHDGQLSPRSMSVNINQDFLYKFRIKTPDEMDEIEI